MFLDLGHAIAGFIDVLHLPHGPGRWPIVGDEIECEVLQHRPGQVRLLPLDSRLRPPGDTFARRPDDWERLKAIHRVGDVVTATVRETFRANREYIVEFDGEWAVLEWSDTEPAVGAVGRYRINGLLDTSRRVLLREER